MVISEMIKQLEELKEKHGNVPVYYSCGKRSYEGYAGYEIGGMDYEDEISHPDYDNENDVWTISEGIFAE